MREYYDCECAFDRNPDSYSGYRRYLPPMNPSLPAAGDEEEVYQSNAAHTGAGGHRRPAASGPDCG